MKYEEFCKVLVSDNIKKSDVVDNYNDVDVYYFDKEITDKEWDDLQIKIQDFLYEKWCRILKTNQSKLKIQGNLIKACAIQLSDYEYTLRVDSIHEFAFKATKKDQLELNKMLRESNVVMSVYSLSDN